jgi:gas vesicle protein
MNNTSFIKGVSLGIMAGAVIGMAVKPQKRTVKHMTGKVLKTAGDIIENLTDTLGR